MRKQLINCNVSSYLLLVAIIAAWSQWKPLAPDRWPAGPAVAPVSFTPVRLDPAGFKPLRLAGAWRVSVADRRFGGISALGRVGSDLLALSDAGVVIRLPRPGARNPAATLLDLPDGPGSPRFKSNRDTEALAADPAGRGWWVSFENRNELWLFSPGFARALEQHKIRDPSLSRNLGVEALVPVDRSLLMFPERGTTALRLLDGRQTRLAWSNPYGHLSEAARLPDGSILLIARHLGWKGIDNRLLTVTAAGGALRTHELARLPVGAMNNLEGMTAEPLADGGTRLWLMTDNDFSAIRPTLLLALDLPPGLVRRTPASP